MTDPDTDAQLGIAVIMARSRPTAAGGTRSTTARSGEPLGAAQQRERTPAGGRRAHAAVFPAERRTSTDAVAAHHLPRLGRYGGSNGGTTNTGSGGGASAFSAAIDTATLDGHRGQRRADDHQRRDRDTRRHRREHRLRAGDGRQHPRRRRLGRRRQRHSRAASRSPRSAASEPGSIRPTALAGPAFGAVGAATRCCSPRHPGALPARRRQRRDGGLRPSRAWDRTSGSASANGSQLPTPTPARAAAAAPGRRRARAPRST